MRSAEYLSGTPSLNSSALTYFDRNKEIPLIGYIGVFRSVKGSFIFIFV